ncbi:MAG: Gfo/Idh/MocA family oxidoreductase [Planctomycetota bacterium]
MTTRKLRVGVVGAGGIARSQHFPNWKTLPDVAITTLCDIREEAAKEAARQFQIPNVFTRYQDVVSRDDVDVVDVCTPNRAHTPVVLAALSAGKHVLCEKPLATTTAEVIRMGRLADKKRLVLMTAQHQRFSPGAKALHEFATGGLGHVYHARVHATRRTLLPAWGGFIDKKLSGGGPCMDIGVHALDLALWLMNFPTPVRVSGSAKVNFARGNIIPGGWGEWDRKRFSVEDFAAGFIHFSNGATMILESSWLSHQKDDEEMSATLYGIKASLHWPTGEFWSTRGRSLTDGVVKSAQRSGRKAHAEEIAAFHDAVVNRRPSPVPWRQTVRVIGILEAIYRSSETGREISLKLPE